MKKEPLRTKHRGKAIEWIKLIIEKNKTIGYFNQNILELFLLMSINWSFNPRFIRGNESGKPVPHNRGGKFQGAV
jgi:hypothetical protein